MNINMCSNLYAVLLFQHRCSSLDMGKIICMGKWTVFGLLRIKYSK